MEERWTSSDSGLTTGAIAATAAVRGAGTTLSGIPDVHGSTAAACGNVPVAHLFFNQVVHRASFALVLK